MPQVDPRQAARNRRYKRVAFVASAVVAAVVAVVWLWSLSWDAQRSATVNKQAAQLDGQKQYDAEMSLLSDYVQSKPPAQYRYPALVKLGDLELQQYKYALASQYYVQAVSLNQPPDVHLVTGLAQASAGLGDRVNAIKYYKQAIAMTPKTDHQQIDTLLEELLPLEHARGGNQ